MRHSRTIATLLAVGVLASAAVAQAGGLPTLAGFSRDRVWTKGEDDSTLHVAVTYANPIGNQYVAYVRLTWGQLTPAATGAGGPSYQQWKGELEVDDDGVAILVSTEGFEVNQQVIQPFDATAYHKAVREWQQGRISMIQRSSQRRLHERKQAMEKVKNERKLLKRLEKIDRQHAERIAKFDKKMVAELAELRDKLGETFILEADRITKDDDDEIAWQSTTYGDSDGILVKLVLEDADTDVKIKAGGHKISFETRPAPNVVVAPPVVNTSYRRVLYSSDTRPHNRHVTVYNKYLHTRPSTTVYSSYGYGSGRSGYPITVYPSIYVGSGDSRCYSPSRVSRHGRRSGISAHGSFSWSNGHIRARVNSSSGSHSRSRHGSSRRGSHSSGDRSRRRDRRH